MRLEVGNMKWQGISFYFEFIQSVFQLDLFYFFGRVDHFLLYEVIELLQHG